MPLVSYLAYSSNGGEKKNRKRILANLVKFFWLRIEMECKEVRKEERNVGEQDESEGGSSGNN